ncbi:MAG: dihydroorotate dehydrogenase electron transfer subunit [Dehalococcoidia bacterium]
MKLIDAPVVEVRELYPSNWIVWLDAPEIARGASVGQFVMVYCGEGIDPFLPRALSIHRLRPGRAGQELALLFTVVGRGTAWLSRRKPGDTVSLFGTLGHGYQVGAHTRNLLLVAGGIGVAPLVWLADERVARGDSVTLLVGARTAGQLYPAELLPPEVEVIACTDDGSAGRQALVAELLPEYLLWADQVFACGPAPMFRSMATMLRRSSWKKPVQALLEERMACGTGICYSCAVETRRGMRLICKDGPCFELRDVY